MNWYVLAAMDLLSRAVLSCAEEGVPPPCSARMMECRFAKVRAVWALGLTRDRLAGVEVTLQCDVPLDQESAREAFVAALTISFADSARLDERERTLHVKLVCGATTSASAHEWAEDVQREIETQEGQCE